MRRSFSALLPALALLVLPCPAVAQEKKVDVSFRPAMKFFDTDGPVEVVVMLRNRTGGPVDTSPGMSIDDGCVLKDRSGNVLPKSGVLEKEGAKLPETLDANAAFDRTVNLRLGYPQLATPGIYTVTWEHPKVKAKAPEIRIVPRYDPKAAHTATIETDQGVIEVALSSAKAPNHVYNFVQLARCGFYDGLTFHRIVDGFMIQGGDPKADGTGTAGYYVRAEPSDLKHEKGALAMARSDDPNSASCQFYICLAPQPKLDGKYTVFGHVTKGMDVVEAIGKIKTGPDDRPLQPVRIKTVTITASPAAAAPAPAAPAPAPKAP